MRDAGVASQLVRLQCRFDKSRSLAVRRVEQVHVIALSPHNNTALVREFPESLDSVMASHAAHPHTTKGEGWQPPLNGTCIHCRATGRRAVEHMIGQGLKT